MEAPKLLLQYLNFKDKLFTLNYCVKANAKGDFTAAVLVFQPAFSDYWPLSSSEDWAFSDNWLLSSSEDNIININYLETSCEPVVINWEMLFCTAQLKVGSQYMLEQA